MREAASFWSLPWGRVVEELVLGLEDEEGMDWSSLALAADTGRRPLAAAAAAAGRRDRRRSGCPSWRTGGEKGLFVNHQVDFIKISDPIQIRRLSPIQ